MDAFIGHNLTIDDTLQQQLLMEGTKLVKFSLKPTGLTTTLSNHSSRSSPLQEHHISVVALGLLLSVWIITAMVANMMYRYIQKLQARMDSLMFVPHFTRQSAAMPLALSCSSHHSQNCSNPLLLCSSCPQSLSSSCSHLQG